MRIVKVKFLSTKDSQTSDSYYYKDDLSRALKPWDAVLVPTRYGLSLAIVEQTSVKESDLVNAGRFGATLSTAVLKTVSEKIKSKVVDEELKVRKADAIKKKLESEIKKFDETQKYKMYAEQSPEIATMLAELEELRG